MHNDSGEHPARDHWGHPLIDKVRERCYPCEHPDTDSACQGKSEEENLNAKFLDLGHVLLHNIPFDVFSGLLKCSSK